MRKLNLSLPLIVLNISILFLVGILVFKESIVPEYKYS